MADQQHNEVMVISEMTRMKSDSNYINANENLNEIFSCPFLYCKEVCPSGAALYCHLLRHYKKGLARKVCDLLKEKTKQ